MTELTQLSKQHLVARLLALQRENACLKARALRQQLLTRLNERLCRAPAVGRRRLAESIAAVSACCGQSVRVQLTRLVTDGRRGNCHKA